MTLAAPTHELQRHSISHSISHSYHPVVIWHGLGDSAYADGMKSLADELRNAFPGIFVHLVSLADGFAADQRAGFFGDVNSQVDQVCEELALVQELQGGFDAIGFSQGGQFMRAYVQRCNRPAVRNLVTFGSQHMGISDFPACKPADFLCRLAEGALRSGVYSDYSQSHIVTAQYFRNPKERTSYDKYLEANHFLADINNENNFNETYKTNLQSLDNLVLLMFDQDLTVVPRQSSWFSSYAVAQKEAGNENIVSLSEDDADIIPLRQSPIYEEDRIGLRTLDKRGALVMDACHGMHMHIDAACSAKVFGQYIGIPPPSAIVPSAVRHAWARLVFTLTGLRMSLIPTSAQLALVAGMVLMCTSLSVLLGRSSRSIRLE